MLNVKVFVKSFIFDHNFFLMNVNCNASDDQDLLKKLQEGDSSAFKSLFDKYWEPAYSNAYKRIKNSEDAQDIVQEIFTHIWQNRNSLQINNLPAYLHVAVRNKVFKLVSRQKDTHPFFHIFDNLVLESAGADARLLWQEFYNSYEALVKTLPTKRQEIFRLRFHDDLTTQDIAKNLAITRKTVQNQIGKALETLKISLTHPLSFFLIILDLNKHI